MGQAMEAEVATAERRSVSAANPLMIGMFFLSRSRLAPGGDRMFVVHMKTLYAERRNLSMPLFAEKRTMNTDSPLSEAKKLKLGLTLRILWAREKKFGKSRGSKTRAAEKFGVSRSRWDDIESTRHNPRLDGLIRLADFLDVSIDWLVTGIGDPEKKSPGVTPRPRNPLAEALTMKLSPPPKECPNAEACLRQAKILQLVAASVASLSDSDRFDECLDSLVKELLHSLRSQKSDPKDSSVS